MSSSWNIPQTRTEPINFKSLLRTLPNNVPVPVTWLVRDLARSHEFYKRLSLCVLQCEQITFLLLGLSCHLLPSSAPIVQSCMFWLRSIWFMPCFVDIKLNVRVQIDDIVKLVDLNIEILRTEDDVDKWQWLKNSFRKIVRDRSFIWENYKHDVLVSTSKAKIVALNCLNWKNHLWKKGLTSNLVLKK